VGEGTKGEKERGATRPPAPALNLATPLSQKKKKIGIQNFEVRPSTFAEDLPKTGGGAAYAVATARAKAAEVSAAIAAEGPSPSPSLVIAADTVVERGGGPSPAILEKPDDDAHAAAMLASLAGTTHAVHTGVALVLVPAGSDGADSPTTTAATTTRAWAETTAVTFAPLTPAEIDAYVATGEAAGKAGGYGIQGAAGAWVTRIEGCYFNVVGLPLSAVSREIVGVLVEAGVLE
jgi:septum formation protein